MKRNLCDLEDSTFDLLVVGGGIHGANVCMLGALSGLKVALIEQGDFGHSTSANSQKIMHGGLRYLQTMDLPRLMQSLRERNRLMVIAPHLVHPLKCVMPLYGHGIKGKESLIAGTCLYNFLSECSYATTKHRVKFSKAGVIGKEEFLETFPEVERDRLTGAAVWHEGICQNTERLVLSFIKFAHQSGAVISNYTRAIKYKELREGNVLVLAEDTLSGQTLEVKAKRVITCTGPWYQDMAKMIKGAGMIPTRHFAAGLNLVIKRLFPHQTAVGLAHRTDAGSRLFFVVPWRNRTIIGTDWFPINDDMSVEQCVVTEEHCAKFLQEFNETYPASRVTLKDISYIHWGLVPCRNHNGYSKKMPAISKKFELLDMSNFGGRRIIHVLGVKFTTAGDVAQKALKFADPERKYQFDILDRLAGRRIANLSEFRKETKNKWAGKIDEDSIDRLVVNYGTELDLVLSGGGLRDNDDSGNAFSREDIIKAETLFSVRHEMAQKLGDVVFRRTDTGTASSPSEAELRVISNVMGSEFGWSETKLRDEMEEVRRAYPPFIIDSQDDSSVPSSGGYTF